MNSDNIHQEPQAPSRYRFQCIACASLDTGEGSTLLRTDRDGPGDYSMLCQQCTPRLENPRYREMVQIAAIARVSLREALAVLERTRQIRATGVDDFWRQLDEVERELQLPAMSAAIALGEFAARHPRNGRG